MRGKAPGKRLPALLLIALMAATLPTAWTPEAEGQVSPISYEFVVPANVTIPMNPRPGGYNIGHFEIEVVNTGYSTLGISIEFITESISLFPVFNYIILNSGESRINTIILIENENKYIRNSPVIIEARGREGGRYFGHLSYSKTISFQLSSIPGNNSIIKPDLFVPDYYKSFAISDSGKLLFEGRLYSEEKLQLTQNYQTIWEKEFYLGRDDELALSGDGRYIAATKNRNVHFYVHTRSAPIWTADLGSPISSLELSAGGNVVAAGTTSGNLSLFDNASSAPLWTHTGDGGVAALAVADDGALMAAAFVGGNVSLFGRDSATPRWTHAAGSAARTLAMSGDGEYFAAGTAAGKLNIYHRDISAPLRSHALDGAVEEVAMSGDGRWIAAATANGTLALFQRQGTGPEWQKHYDSAVASVSMSADGEYLSAGAGHAVLMLAREDGAELWNYSANNDVEKVQLSADGEWLGVLADSLMLFYTDVHPIAVIDAPSPGLAAVGDRVTFRGHGTAYGAERDFTDFIWNSSRDGLLSTDSTFYTNDLSAGDHLISLTVRDNDGDWSLPRLMPLRVRHRPVADAGRDITVAHGTTIVMSGRAIDGDDDVVLYEWDFDGDGEWDWSNGKHCIAEHTYEAEGTYRAVLRVTDAEGFNDTDTVVISPAPLFFTVAWGVLAGPPPGLLLAAVGVAALMARRRR